jgi:hypothetical protein
MTSARIEKNEVDPFHSLKMMAWRRR